MGRLAYVVWVDGEPYGPGEVGGDVASRITNPGAWEGGTPPSGVVAPLEPETAPPSVSPAPTPAPTGDGDTGDLDRPPTAGAGSGKDKWAAYAASKGVAVTDDMTRDEMVAAVDALPEQN